MTFLPGPARIGALREDILAPLPDGVAATRLRRRAMLLWGAAIYLGCAALMVFARP